MTGNGLAVQGSLFDHDERRDLGDGAWIDVRAGWLTGGLARGDRGGARRASSTNC